MPLPVQASRRSLAKPQIAVLAAVPSPESGPEMSSAALRTDPPDATPPRPALVLGV